MRNIFLTLFITLCYQVVWASNLDGKYSQIIDGPKGKRLVNLYLKFLPETGILTGKMEWYPKKKEKGIPSEYFFHSYFEKEGQNYSLNNFSFMGPRAPWEIETLKINKNGIYLNSKEGVRYTITGNFVAVSDQEGYFLAMDKLYERVFGNLIRKIEGGIEFTIGQFKKGRRFNRVWIPNAPSMNELTKAKRLKALFPSSNRYNSKTANVDIEATNLRNALSYMINFTRSPALCYLPNVEVIEFYRYDAPGEKIFEITAIERRKKSVDFQLVFSDSAKKELVVHENKKIEEEKERKRLLAEQKASLLAKDKKMAARGGNPSNIIIEIDNKPKSELNDFWSALLGDEYMEKANQLFQGMGQKVANEITPGYRPIEYFKKIYYGDFGQIEYRRYLDDYFLGFFYHAQRKFGRYYEDMKTDKFDIMTTEVVTDQSGFVRKGKPYVSNTYEIEIPTKMYGEFVRHKGDASHFFGGGGKFTTDYMVLSFLEKYPPSSIPFKQMAMNLYRYSKKKPAVKSLDELKELK